MYTRIYKYLGKVSAPVDSDKLQVSTFNRFSNRGYVYVRIQLLNHKSLIRKQKKIVAVSYGSIVNVI